MKINDINEMIDNDSAFLKEECNIDTASLSVPELCGKYHQLIYQEKLSLEYFKVEFKVLKKDRWLYYTGKLGEEDLKKHDWEPFPLNILKTDIDKFLQSDSDIHRIEAKIILHKFNTFFVRQKIMDSIFNILYPINFY